MIGEVVRCWPVRGGGVSRGIPGCSESVPGCYGRVRRCSGVFRACSGPVPSFTNTQKFELQILKYTQHQICIGNSTILVIFGINTTSDVSKLLCVISRAVRRVKFETILKYHEWYLCQISRSNHAIICLYCYPQRFCNFHM